MIAQTSETTHVISYDHSQEHAIQELESYHIKNEPESSFHELLLTSGRSGRCRHTAIHHGDIRTLYQTFTDLRHK